MPEALLAEFSDRARSTPSLAGRITSADLADLAASLGIVAEIAPAITAPIPAVTRDATDDYLPAYAITGIQ